VVSGAAYKPGHPDRVAAAHLLCRPDGNLVARVPVQGRSDGMRRGRPTSRAGPAPNRRSRLLLENSHAHRQLRSRLPQRRGHGQQVRAEPSRVPSRD
jgi:hypothetical protein